MHRVLCSSIREIEWLFYLLSARRMKTIASCAFRQVPRTWTTRSSRPRLRRQQRFAIDRFIERESVPEGPRPEAYRGVARHAGRGGPPGRQRVVRPGCSLSQVIQIVDELVKQRSASSRSRKRSASRKRGHADQGDLALFGLFAEVERDLISERTKEGLAAARAKGRLLGRPKGVLEIKLDDKEGEIRMLLEKKVSRHRSPRSWASRRRLSGTSSEHENSIRASQKADPQGRRP